MPEFATNAIHAGYEPDPTTGAVMPPIYMTSTYAQPFPGESVDGYEYTRAGNPNFTILEKQLAALEHAHYATIFSSGLGALTALASTLNQHDSILAVGGLYGGSYRLFNAVFKRFGVQFIHTLSINLSDIEEALAKKPKWLFFETPTNPLWEISDIAALAAMAKQQGVLTVVDNTVATPYWQNPLLLGADVVWHSTTKYLGGHSDVIGGAVLTNHASIKEGVDFGRKALGLNPSPFDAWLISRGVKTLAVRMEQHQRNANHVAHVLKAHPKVKHVFYPGLETHPNHAIARKQMRGFSGMVSFELNCSSEKTLEFMTRLHIFTLAESLGGVESLISHPATMTHASIPAEQRALMGISEGLVRLSVGIEASQDLINDLKQALDFV